MHNMIIEIRPERPFSDCELQNGVMNIDEILADYGSLYFDYIREHPDEREDCLDRFAQRIGGIFDRNGDCLTFHQAGYERFILAYIYRIQRLVAEITPWNFFPEKQWQLHKLARLNEEWCDVFVYTEDNGIQPVDEWLMTSGIFDDKEGEGREYYIGKVYDYHG